MRLSFHKLSILMAAYNEEETLAPCLMRVLAAALPGDLQREVIIVDDGSRDGTWRVMQELAAQHPEVRVFQQPENRGKGAALRRCIAEMTGDLALFQDADLEYDPHDYPRLIRPILDGRAEVVFGSRFIGEERKVLYFWHTMGNRLLTLLSNMLNDTNLTDMETCYKAFTAQALRTIPLESNRFGIEPEITAKVARNRFRMFEVPISYDGRRYDEGKKITWRDGCAALWFIFKYRFTSRYADTGKVTLDAIDAAPRFNAWMFSVIEPFLGRRIAELGVGRGNISRFLRDRADVLLTDYRTDYLQQLQERWQHLPRLQIGKLDLTVRADYEILRRFAPDSVVFFNVLEHLEDDAAVLKNLCETVPDGCRVTVLVPFNPKLYSQFDRDLGHFRRYRAGELEEKLRGAGFTIERQFYFNKVAALAWWLRQVVFRQKNLGTAQLRVFNFLTPLLRVLDPMLPTTGLSTVVVARKEPASPLPRSIGE